MTDLEAMADQILAAARNGALIFPGPSGNSVAVPCVEWIARRLVEVDKELP